MSRGPRDEAYRRSFGDRLRRLIEVELRVPIAEAARHLGYQDGSTLRAAMAGRCGLDLDRLAALALWSKAQGVPVNLHWLLVGEGLPIQPISAGKSNGWLTPELREALVVIAGAVPSLPARRGVRDRPLANGD